MARCGYFGLKYPSASGRERIEGIFGRSGTTRLPRPIGGIAPIRVIGRPRSTQARRQLNKPGKPERL